VKETKLQMIIERSIDGNKPRNELDLIHATENKSFIRSADQACQNRSELELEYHTKYIHSYSDHSGVLNEKQGNSKIGLR